MKMSYDDRRLRVSRGPRASPPPSFRDLTNARVHVRRNASVVNSLYVCQARLSNVIVDRYQAAAAAAAEMGHVDRIGRTFSKK